MARKKQPASKPSRGKRAAAASVTRMLHSLKSGRDVRTTKVRKLRAAVRAKRYENDLKLSIAADRLIAAITGT